jgi:hypothetical protein
MSEEKSRSRRLAAALGLGLAIAGIPALGAEHKFDGVYVGKRSLTEGSTSSFCPAEEDVSVIIQGDTMSFTDRAFKKFAISFYPSQDGSFGEIYTGEGGGAVRIRGRVVGDVMEADVSNPPCNHHRHLKKE